MANLVDKKCASTEWFTPPEILGPVRQLFGGEIGLDPCTTEGNPTKARRFYTEGIDGLTEPFNACRREDVYVNPPYGDQLYRWIAKVAEEAELGHRIVQLVSASSRWDQERWQRIFSRELAAMLMPIGRVKFLDAEGNRWKSPPYPSLLFFYNLPVGRVHCCFEHLGKVVETRP